MDFTNHPLNSNRLSRIEKLKQLKQSSIDNRWNHLTERLHDTTLDKGFVAETLAFLSEHDVDQVADYVTRKANTPGRAFVSICNKKMVDAGWKL